MKVLYPTPFITVLTEVQAPNRICQAIYDIVKLGQHWFREWLDNYVAPSHFLIQCCFIVIWTRRNKFQWNLNQNAFSIKKIHLKMLYTKQQPFCGHMAYRSRSTLDQIMPHCLMVPCRYLNQCCLIISKVLWHSSEISQPSITKISLKITYLKFQSNLTGLKELIGYPVFHSPSTKAYSPPSPSWPLQSEIQYKKRSWPWPSALKVKGEVWAPIVSLGYGSINGLPVLPSITVVWNTK